MDRLDELESRSIYVIREAYREYGEIAALWSIGKDSTAMAWLIRKAFYGKIPFPFIHIDTAFKFPEMYTFREKYAKEWGTELLVARNDEALKAGMGPEKGKLECCTALKTNALKRFIDKRGFKALLLGIRRDEHGIRAKERYFCFPKGTLVYGQEVKPIEEVRSGDLIFTHRGSPRKVLDVFSRRYKGEIISISTQYGAPFLTTPNHTIFAKVEGRGKKEISVRSKGLDGKKRDIVLKLTGRHRIAWRCASELKEGNLLYIPKIPKKSQDCIRTPHSIAIQSIIGRHEGLIKRGRQTNWKSAHKQAPKIRESFPLSPNMLRIMGYYVAEGSANLGSNQFSFAFHSNEEDLINDVLKEMEKNFGVEGNVRIKGNASEITYSSKTLALLFSKLCGNGARNRVLPYFFTLLSKERLCQLVKGCWLGDGSKERYSTVSKLLAHQLRMALLRLGILSSIRKDKQERYHLSVAGVSKERFTEIFGLECSVPYINRCTRAHEIDELHASELSETDYGRSGSGGFWIPIRGIERLPYEGMVYDLKVEGDSSYLVNGLAVHNSPRDENFKWNYKEQPPELWDQYTVKKENATHIRVHPILHWSELDIWEYIKRENIPVNELYFAKDGKRYRSLGCYPCTKPVESNASTVDEIIEELKSTKVGERSGRAQDKEQAYMMQKLRVLGYM